MHLFCSVGSLLLCSVGFCSPLCFIVLRFDLWPLTPILWLLAGVWTGLLDRRPPPAFGRGPSCCSCDVDHCFPGPFHWVRQQHCHNYHISTRHCWTGKTGVQLKDINWVGFCVPVMKWPLGWQYSRQTGTATHELYRNVVCCWPGS